MRALAALLLAPSLSFASWTFESYSDANGMWGFKTFRDGVEQYDMAPSYDPQTATSFTPVDVNDDGYLIGNASVVDFSQYGGNAWDLMMFVLDPTGGVDMGLWTGEAGWIGGTWACANMGWGYRPTLIDVGSGEMVDSKPCYQVDQENPFPDAEMGEARAAAVPEPTSLALLIASGLLLGIRGTSFPRGTRHKELMR